MKVLVTGGAGFQGSHICEYLVASGHDVTILNHDSPLARRNIRAFEKKVKVVWGSVVNAPLVASALKSRDTVLHLAAKIHVDESIAHPTLYLQKNITGTFTVLEEIKKVTKKRPRLIYWSSCEVYGAPMTSEKLTEESPMRPQSPYAATKAAADSLCFAYNKTYGVDVTIVRPFNIFGPRQKIGIYGSLIPTMVENGLSRVPLVVRGTGQQTRDFMYIDDLVNAFSLVLNNSTPPGLIINFASGRSYSVAEIANYIAKRLNVRVIRGPERPGDVARFPADITLARKLGFKPKVPIWKGIDRYIDWRLSQKSFEPEPAKYSDWLRLYRLFGKFALPARGF